MTARTHKSDKQPGLKRSLSLTMLTYYGLGNVLGAGIYVLIGKVAAHAGPLAPLSFLLAAVLAGLTALSYAELSARYPVSAGEVIYIEKGLGIHALSLLTGVLIIITGIVSAATIARGFVGYLNVFLAVPDILGIGLLVLALGALAAWGIQQSITVAALMTLVEIGGLIFILWVAQPGPDAIFQSLDRLTEPLATGSAQGIFLGAFLAFYAFIGFEDMVNVAEEVKHPRRNLPLAIGLSLVISSLLYFAVAIVAVSAVDSSQLGQSEAPLAYLYQVATGSEPTLITAISLVAVVNGALIQIIMASRVCYGMGKRGWAPAWLASINPLTRTPLLATIMITLLVLIMALWLPTESLARATSFAVLPVFILVNAALWRIKGRAGDGYGEFRVYRWVPAAAIAGAVVFITLQLISM